MERNQNLIFSKFLFILSFSGFFSAVLSCTPPKKVSTPPPASKPVVTIAEPIYPDAEKIDSAKVVLFLDTTYLGPFYFPVKGKVISPYGRRGQRMHTGTDIKLSKGDTVKAAFRGVVTKASTYYGYGILVVLKHPKNLETYYAHLSKALVNVGDEVEYGQPVGLGGRTGRATTEHLHFELRNNGKPLNAEHFFNFNTQNIKTLVWVKNTELESAEKVAETKTVSAKAAGTETNSVRKYHTIKKGDTLFSISKKYGTTVDKICKLNNIKKSSVLKIGNKLQVN